MSGESKEYHRKPDDADGAGDAISDLDKEARKSSKHQKSTSNSKGDADGASTSGAIVSKDHKAGAPSPASSQYPELMRTMQELLENQRRGTKCPNAAAEEKTHQFWSTQPVPKYDEKVPPTVNDPIEVKSMEDVRREPYQLPSNYFWDTLDVNHKGTLDELYALLHDNYVEDDDAMFRFRYSHEFLLWALKPPGWVQPWHLGVRVNGTNKLVGFISAVPAQIRVKDKVKSMSEVNFLCVHKKLRSKRMAVILIKEITRRCNMHGVFQAVYTAGAVIPKPVGTCRYWHRSINPQKLVDVNFSSVGKNMTMQRMKKLYKLPDDTKTPGFRPVEVSDVPQIFNLLSTYLKNFDLAPEFRLEEVEHYFVPKDKIIYSYVVDGANGITDFCSFYSLPSTVVNHTMHESIFAAYSYYNVATKTSWDDLMMDVIIMAKKNGFDVFNALDLMDNPKFIKDLKFGVGDGELNYYVFNWKCSELKPAQIGLVLM